MTEHQWGPMMKHPDLKAVEEIVKEANEIDSGEIRRKRFALMKKLQSRLHAWCSIYEDESGPPLTVTKRMVDDLNQYLEELRGLIEKE